jgi:hypothetical protein
VTSRNGVSRACSPSEQQAPHFNCVRCVFSGGQEALEIPVDPKGSQRSGHTSRTETGDNTLTETVVEKRSSQEIALFALAHQLGYALTPMTQIKKEIGIAIARHMCSRVGNNICQTASYTLPRLDRRMMEELLGTPTLVEGSTATWAPASVPGVALLAEPLLAAASGFFCAGSSRALKTASESVIRVVATLIPTVEISCSGGRGKFEFQYVLSDDMGELHPPKDGNRIEIALSEELSTALREQIFSDVQVMATKGFPLSAAYLRQVGWFHRAQEVEALQLNLVSAHNLVMAGGVRRRADVFEVDRIVSQRVRGRKSKNFLVRWTGYHPSWEIWRTTGSIGDPLETWETWATVSHTEALEAWQDRRLVLLPVGSAL